MGTGWSMAKWLPTFNEIVRCTICNARWRNNALETMLQNTLWLFKWLHSQWLTRSHQVLHHYERLYNFSDDRKTALQSESRVLAPVPLSIFRSNSKFDENSKHSSVKYTRPITTIFCTRHDSITVVTRAKYRCDRSSIIETRAFWIFIEFRIRSKYV